MTRLKTEPIPATDAHAVATNADLHPSAKIIWMYLSAISDPQRVVNLAAALGLDRQTVTRNLRDLVEHRLVYQVNGVWLAEVNQ